MKKNLITSNISTRNLFEIYSEYCYFGYQLACGLFEADPKFTWILTGFCQLESRFLPVY